jgi:hypothetical protein
LRAKATFLTRSARRTFAIDTRAFTFLDNPTGTVSVADPEFILFTNLCIGWAAAFRNTDPFYTGVGSTTVEVFGALYACTCAGITKGFVGWTIRDGVAVYRGTGIEIPDITFTKDRSARISEACATVRIGATGSN